MTLPLQFPACKKVEITGSNKLLNSNMTKTKENKSLKQISLWLVLGLAVIGVMGYWISFTNKLDQKRMAIKYCFYTDIQGEMQHYVCND